jgi:hypothetical protein
MGANGYNFARKIPLPSSGIMNSSMLTPFGKTRGRV